jgi:hypothetical protein
MRTEPDRYHLGMVMDGDELATMEEHLLGCPTCADWAEATGLYLDAVRACSIFKDENGKTIPSRKVEIHTQRVTS